MQLKETLVNTSLLGTGKKQISVSDFPDALQPEITKVLGQNEDNETKFLKTCAAAFNYYRSGIEPIKIEVAANVAEDETLPFCKYEAVRVLDEILEAKNYDSLLIFWTKRCAEKNQVIPAQMLVKYFEGADAIRRASPALFKKVIGNRGLWLSQFTKEWTIKDVVEFTPKEEYDWETGDIYERVGHLRAMRENDAAGALEKLKSVWKVENANTRVELLAALSTNISKDDEEFLIASSNEKSVKVKEKALALLQLIHNSEVVKTFETILKQSIEIKQRNMLGIISRINIEVKLQAGDESIYKMGIDSLSVNKQKTDETYVLEQLIMKVPPVFWTREYNFTITEMVKFFERPELDKFSQALSLAVVRFKDTAWAKEIIEQTDYPDGLLLSVLPKEERRQYAMKFLKNNVDTAISALQTENYQEWDVKLTRDVLLALIEKSYSKSYYQSIALYMSPAILPIIKEVSPQDEKMKIYWDGISEEIEKLIRFKEIIKTAF
ncbi:MAG: hypothetical protein JWO06_2344 [Bacteroidota bacterium]|nr:hypothetical protein [Bacteroidota bacterium]